MPLLRLAALAFAFASCVAPLPPRTVLGFVAPVTETRVDSVIVVALDGVRWQDVFDGTPELTPTLHRWMATGLAVGAPRHGEIWASGPNFVSMPGYTEILTGRPSACQSNACGNVTTPTVVDEVIAAGDEAAVISSWERIARVAAMDPSRATLSTGRHQTARTDGLDAVALEQGRESDAWPGSDDYRPDAITARVALGLLDARLPRFAFFGLGDTDEYAHHGDRSGYRAALHAADRFLSDLEQRITRRTVVFVTSDHGRAASFNDHGGGDHDSGRVWMVVRAPNLPIQGMLDTDTVHLADIAPTIRCLLSLPPDTSAVAGHSISTLCAD